VQKKGKGRRYSLEFKNECLAMYFTGPKLYKKKLRVQFCLPSPTTLMKLVNNLKAGPGLNSPELFKMLQMKTDNFSDDDKYCTLCVDEMSIKANLFYARQSDTILKVIDKTGNDVTNRIKFLNCFKITISGLLHLWNFQLGDKYSFLLTRRMNQDVLENFFGTIRQQNGNCINPTAIQFQRSFKKVMCIKLFHSGTENCEGDGDKMLLRLNDINAEETPSKTPAPINNNEAIVDFDYHTSDILQKKFERYICGYLIRKCLNVHTCSVCENYAHQVKNFILLFQSLRNKHFKYIW
jgi:hypothetical protein